ncbi:hypothetical protein ACWEK7_16625, partial [Streptomyces californicus]
EALSLAMRPLNILLRALQHVGLPRGRRHRRRLRTLPRARARPRGPARTRARVRARARPRVPAPARATGAFGRTCRRTLVTNPARLVARTCPTVLVHHARPTVLAARSAQPYRLRPRGDPLR